MRPRRTRGVRKSYVEEPIISDEDETRHEPSTTNPAKESNDDGDSGAPPSRRKGHVDEDYDDNAADPSPSDDDDDDDDEDMASNGPSPSTNKRTTTAPNSSSTTNPHYHHPPTRSFHTIPPYPLETRTLTRVYAGPLRKYARYSALRDTMFGPEYERIKVAWQLEVRWCGFPVLPPRWPPGDEQGIIRSPWLPEGFEAVHRRRGEMWYADFCAQQRQRERERQQVGGEEEGEGEVVGVQVVRRLSKEEGERLLPREKKGLAVLMGPWDKQREVRLKPGEPGVVTGLEGLPVQEGKTATTPVDWTFDVGGLPLAVAWAPLERTDIQVLAVAAVPFEDQAPRPPGTVRWNAAAATAEGEPERKVGCVQLWEFVPQERQGELPSPSTRPPRLLGAQFFDWGRPKRLKFCPVPMDGCGIYGMMAILCGGDDKVRVIEAKVVEDADVPRYGWIEEPIATFGLTEDYNVKATCLTWVNINRVALGHSDGSITLWSIHPRQLLQRVGAHTTYILDICSGFPSQPYLVTTVPIGGCVTLTDLSQPSGEMTYFPSPAISHQPNLLCWSEVMQGFMALYPTSTPNTTIAFLHHRFFCQARPITTGPNYLMSASAGATHPFLLVGCADGSVFSCNALQKLFKQKGEPMCKLRMFEHEYRPVEGDAEVRGAVRILQGFLPEENDDPRTEKRKESNRKKKKAEKKKKKKRGRRKKGVVEADAADGARDSEAEADEAQISRAIIHEPLTRVTSVQWNPNLPFSCWAACAMASGLIKVMDLGVVDETA